MTDIEKVSIELQFITLQQENLALKKALLEKDLASLQEQEDQVEDKPELEAVG